MVTTVISEVPNPRFQTFKVGGFEALIVPEERTSREGLSSHGTVIRC